MRNLVTLLNARRGVEPCRLVVTQWSNRKLWLADATIQHLTPTERKLISEMKLLNIFVVCNILCRQDNLSLSNNRSIFIYYDEMSRLVKYIETDYKK